jgi:galactose-1-phosphate uridylyltransferase
MGLPTGPHRRYDPLTDQWVLVSTGRTKRPWLGSKERRRAADERTAFDPGCYLCLGNTRVSGAQNLDDAQRDGLTRTMQRLMRRYHALFDQPMPFSMGWHQAPFGSTATEPWQVHAHFMPPLLEATKRKFMVGYELLSELQRDLSAEDAAEQLLAALPEVRDGEPEATSPARPLG